jgi:hypothetical protein
MRMFAFSCLVIQVAVGVFAALLAIDTTLSPRPKHSGVRAW